MTTLGPEPTAPDIFDEFLDKQRRRVEAGRLHKLTYRKYCNSVDALRRHFADRDPLDAEPWEWEDWYDLMPYQTSTRNVYLTGVRTAIKYARKRKVIDEDPTAGLRKDQPPDPEIRIIPNSELRAMKACIERDNHWLLFHLLAYTGMRRFEIAKMVADDVNLKRRTIHVIGKRGKKRLVPIHPELGEVLARERLIIGQRVCKGVYYGGLRKFAEGYGFHDFRRTVATSLDANGVPESLIFRILGWKKNTIFDVHYRNIADERLQAAMLRLYADDPI